jgi:hypothetical protein
MTYVIILAKCGLGVGCRVEYQDETEQTSISKGYPPIQGDKRIQDSCYCAIRPNKLPAQRAYQQWLGQQWPSAVEKREAAIGPTT